MGGFINHTILKYHWIIIICIIFLTSSISVHAQILPTTQPETTEEPEPQWPEDPLDRRTPRGTFSGFIGAVADRDYSKASRFLALDDNISNEEGEELALTLQRLLDRSGDIMPYSWISNEITGRDDDDLPPEFDRIGSVTSNGEEIDLFLQRTEGPEGGPVWLISSGTVEIIASINVEDTLLVERVLPPILSEIIWGGVAVGQWIAAIFLAVFSYFLAWTLIFILRFLIRQFWKKATTEPTAGIINALGLPFRLYFAVLLFVTISQEIGISIILRQRFSGVVIILGLLAFLILLWRLTDFISSFSKERMSLRGHLSGVSIVLFLQRAAKIAIVIFGIIAILGAIGVDVTTGLAALGIGGIALALGAQKTIENFVGSVTVVTDQPVRVGDFCRVGNTLGTVERIGMRSTRIRTLDRTIVTIPNGQFSSESIENYAHRDKFWFHPVFGLRYETTPEQIRYLLVELRAVLYAHPMVSPDPARVRFGGLGADSINLEVFAYILVSTYDEFLEVKEDLLLQMMDVVEESGTGFAFPSQTIYFGRDSGLSKEKSQKAEEKVKQWREKGELQLPQFDPEQIDRIKNKTPYPPQGSVKRKDSSSGTIPGL
ncbi:mechanosensitive ion channel family protein [Salinimicrobium sp. GXAS 041]|uniref:mechanosensitive ion channel family protein n=1 Tax=Salinimicrobium sp. GXAS 041 TaxID=3400806 RepID=UPI003C70F944